MPYFLPRRRIDEPKQWWQISLNCLAGGVLLGAGATHLLPDLVAAATEAGVARQPTPYLFVVLGLLVPVVVEQIDLSRCSSCCGSNRDVSGEEAVVAIELGSVAVTGGTNEEEDDVDSEGGAADDGDNPGDTVALVSSAAGEQCVSEPLSEAGASYRAATTASEAGAVMASVRTDTAGHHSAHQEQALATPVLLAATLGVHSLLEGVGIGVQQEIASSLGIVLAVVAHKGFAGFALGQLFLTAGASLRAAAPGLAVFALATPLGVGIGLLVNSLVVSPWVDIVSVGLASGTFILVSLLEILLPAMEVGRGEIGRRWRWAAFLLGVALFAGLGFLIS